MNQPAHWDATEKVFILHKAVQYKVFLFVLIYYIMCIKIVFQWRPLDVTVQKQVVEELLMMRKEYQTAMILVTHNIGVVRAMADRILVLQNGTVRDYGETKNVLDHSQDPYTQKLMNSVLHLKREYI